MNKKNNLNILKIIKYNKPLQIPLPIILKDSPKLAPPKFLKDI
jgi:hypothetical protein